MGWSAAIPSGQHKIFKEVNRGGILGNEGQLVVFPAGPEATIEAVQQ